MSKNVVFDIEVFKFGWLVSCKDIDTGEFYDFITHGLDADGQELRDWVDRNDDLLLCGFNNKHYDNYILKAIYHLFKVSDIKELNDWIIGGRQGWEWPKWHYHKNPIQAYDIRDDLPEFLSLKEVEGNMGLPIKESTVDFDLDRPLTDDEWLEVIEYCHSDIEATDRLRQDRQAYLDSKVYVGRQAGLSDGEALAMTNAKLTAAYLVGPNARPVDWDDELDYIAPDNLKINNQQVINFFKDIDPKYKKKESTMIAGVEHTLAYGGLHGARPNYIGNSGNGRTLINADVVSYYPSLMIQNGYVSRNVKHPGDYLKVFEERVEAKRTGDKAKNEALKLVLNTTYGAMKNQYNPLYDPLMANSVCISGQLYLIDLIEHLESVPSFELVQSNTDGILFVVNDVERLEALKIINEWEHRTGFEMEYEHIEAIYQKDVNNYVLKSSTGKVKVKGGYVSNYDGGGINNASISIVAKAIVEYLLNDTPPAQTILHANNTLDYQFIAKTGRTYDNTIHLVDGQEVDVQRVNRVYATKNKKYGTLYKVKNDANRKDKIANLPDHCIIDNLNKINIDEIDKNFYIEMALKRIQDFVGDQPIKKKGDNNMPMRPVNTLPIHKEDNMTEINTLNAKLFELRKVMSSFVWEKDGKNLQQKYKYITETQYKKYFQRALEQVELDYHVQVVEMDFTPNITDKMHLTSIKAIFTILDPVTGEGRQYGSFGQGADFHDKGVYKAMTGCLKYFIANNFLINDGSDPENDESDVKPSTRPVSPERREQVKTEIMANDEPVTDAQKQRIKDLRDTIKESDGQDEIIKKINQIMKNQPTKVQANVLIMELEDIADDLEIL